MWHMEQLQGEHKVEKHAAAVLVYSTSSSHDLDTLSARSGVPIWWWPKIGLLFHGKVIKK